MNSFIHSRLFVPCMLCASIVLGSCAASAVQSALTPHAQNAAAIANAGAKVPPPSTLFVQDTSCVGNTNCSVAATFTELPGMSLTLPAATAGLGHAIVTFNANSVNVTNTNTAPSSGVCFFEILAGNTTVGAGSIQNVGGTANQQLVVSERVVGEVNLTSAAQTIQAEGEIITGDGTCTLFGINSLSAQLIP